VLVLRRHSLGLKLTLAFVGVGGLVLALVFLGDRTIREAARQLETTRQQQLLPLVQLNTLQAQVARIRVLEIELARIEDLFAMSDQVSFLRSEALAFDVSLQGWAQSASVLPENDRARLIDHWTRYRADLEWAMELAMAMDSRAVAALSTFESAPRQQAITRMLLAASANTEREAEQHLAAAAQARERQRAWFIAVSLSGLLLVGAGLGALTRQMLRRIAGLRAAAMRVAEGAAQLPVPVNGGDELADLGDAFNTLQDRVAEREALLRTARSELEGRVEQRTNELASANTALLHEVHIRRRAEEQLQRQAQYDSLTELPNRSLALERLSQALLCAERSGMRAMVVFVDLDDFKKVNDTLGHAGGDALLVQAALRLRESVRASDTVARLGGDEFIIVLGDLVNIDSTHSVLDKLRHAFQPAFTIADASIHITPSLGMAVYPDDGSDPATLLRNADLAMYEAKAAGRNTCRFFNVEMHERATRNLGIEARLRVAVERDEMWLSFQPVVAALNGRLSGAETLLRWTGPDGIAMPPEQFIPIAERTGLIVPLGRWVMEQACAQMARWSAAGTSLEYISVNVSPREFRDPELTDSVLETLMRNGLKGRQLQIEVTEGLMIDDQRGVREALLRLSQAGVRLAMDDFGTGYSSLSCLHRFPFDVLKIDREFVGGIDGDDDARALVAAAVRLGHELGLDVVAEGVENAKQQSILRQLGCPLLQGYHVGRPLPAHEFHTHWLRRDSAFSAAPARKETLPLVG
jgi:diguanylate cyclase (GGDEF)-like protein